jgi:CxxC-x17-CxxC domain-containing protein
MEMEEERKMYKATCSECGQPCEVPFEPTEGKPVKCKECYMKSRPRRNFNNNGRRSFGGNRRFGGDRQEREMHDATCSECDKNVKFLSTTKVEVLC